MSRIGKKIIELPDKVEVKIKDGAIQIQGPKGISGEPMAVRLPKGIEVLISDKQVEVKRLNELRQSRELHGVTRTLISNMVRGVSQGFEVILEIEGLGLKANVEGKVLNLNLGFTQPIKFELPKGIQAKVDGNTKIILSGPDKEVVGRIAAIIKGFKPPEPYKGTGIRYAGEVIIKKAGKTTGATAS